MKSSSHGITATPAGVFSCCYIRNANYKQVNKTKQEQAEENVCTVEFSSIKVQNYENHKRIRFSLTKG